MFLAITVQCWRFGGPSVVAPNEGFSASWPRKNGITSFLPNQAISEGPPRFRSATIWSVLTELRSEMKFYPEPDSLVPVGEFELPVQSRPDQEEVLTVDRHPAGKEGRVS